MSSRDNSYANTDKKTLFLSDDVDNESIGKLTWSILQQIREDDEKDEEESCGCSGLCPGSIHGPGRLWKKRRK